MAEPGNDGPRMTAGHGLGLLAVLVVTLALLHASRFWPAALNDLGLAGDDWLAARLPAGLKPYAIVIWGGLVFAVLSVAQSIVKRLPGKR